MTIERLTEIVHGLLEEQEIPLNAAKVLPPGQGNVHPVVRFGVRLQSQHSVDLDFDSEEVVIKGLRIWLAAEVRATAKTADPEA